MNAPDNPSERREPAPPEMPDVPRGILVLDKPVGPSSMRAVAIVRRRVGDWLRAETARRGLDEGPRRRLKVGHAGTLDPLASGVLILGVGRATRALDQFMGLPKGYRTRIDLSAFTTTDDDEGERTEVAVSDPPDAAAIRAALATFEGVIQQRPPAYSAVKVDGRRAYAVARGGGTPEIAARPVTVHALELVAYDWPHADVAIACGKGFYVRSFARDLGTHLGTGGTCRSIRRTAIGPFTLDDTVTLDGLPETIGPGALIDLDAARGRVADAASDVRSESRAP